MNSDARRSGQVTPEVRGRAWVYLLAIVLACAAVFGGVAGNGILQWDDRYHTIENPWFDPINQESFARFWREQYGNLFVPVAYNVLAAEIWLTQQATGEARIQHLHPALLQCFKVLLHAASSVMVFVLIRRLVTSDWAAFAAALFFALHPFQAESVAWISETRGLLGSAFGLASILALGRACGTGSAPNRSPPIALPRGTVSLLEDFATRASWWFIAALLFAAALLSKPATVTIPCIAAAWLWAAGTPPKRVLLAIAPLLVLAGADVVITRSVQSAAIIPDAPAWWMRPIIASDAVCFYVGRLLWPVGLAPDYGRTPTHVLAEWGSWWGWLALVLAGTGSAGYFWLARRSRVSMAAGAIFVLALLPVMGLSTFHHQVISTVADRYAYLALAGAALGVAVLLSRCNGRAVWMTAWASLLALGVMSFRQVRHWHSDETLWLHTLEVNPRSPVAHNNLAREYQRQGRLGEAEPHLARAAELDPTSPGILVNLSELRAAQSRLSEAELLGRRAVELAPRETRSLINLAIILAQTSRESEAAALFRRALDVDPHQPEAIVNLAVLDMRAGRLDAAATSLEQVLAAQPTHPQALYNLGLVRAEQGRLKEAADVWGRAIGAGIRSLDVYLRRADALARAQIQEEAEFAYQEAIGAHPHAFEPWNNLGLLYIRLGRVSDAVTMFERAAAASPNAPEPRENLASARRLLEQQR